jgi:hypothetical protein
VKIAYRSDHFLFSSVFTYSNNQTEILKKKKNQNQFQPTSFGLVWFFMSKTKKTYIVYLGFFLLSNGLSDRLVIDVNIV